MKTDVRLGDLAPGTVFWLCDGPAARAWDVMRHSETRTTVHPHGTSADDTLTMDSELDVYIQINDDTSAD